MTFDTFWIPLEKEYPIVSSSAVDLPLPFSTTYLSELCFSSLASIKNKYRECLRAKDQELRVCLSSIPARIEQLCVSSQAQITH